MLESFNFFKQYFKRIGFALLLFFVCRLLFLVFNYELIGYPSLYPFLGGLRFDISSVALLFAPFTILFFLPLIKKQSDKYRVLLNFFYYLGIISSVFLNMIDVIYFRFTLKRTTADVLTVMGNNYDLISLLPHFIVDFWYVVLLFIALILFVFFFVKRYLQVNMYPLTPLLSVLYFFIMTGFLLVGFRGGIQYKPITIVNAATYASPQQIPFVLNTPFTFFKTLMEPRLNPKIYMQNEELLNYFNADITFKSNHSFKNKNVVLIILESFSKEYIGFYNQGKGYTPFLDSLLSYSTVYTNCFANGKQSIEGIPAITASLPTLMDDSYITSPYAGNNINSFATILNKQGYQSYFFHGGNNGTMSFDAFAKVAGYDFYFGKNEYPFNNDADSDWGIFDEPYLQYVSYELSKKQQPFHAAIFTLSSHHPYKVPEKYKDKFPKGEYPIHESIGYADFSLRKFFERATHANWYKNSIFVITTDHTSMSRHKYYSNNVGNYAIPFAIFDPENPTLKTVATICQQTDILPNLLRLLNYNGVITSFGNITNNMYDDNFCVNYSSGIYQYMNDSCIIQFDGEKSIALYNYKTDSLLTKNVLKENNFVANKMENRLKAIIQTYQQRLLENKLTPH